MIWSHDTGQMNYWGEGRKYIEYSDEKLICVFYVAILEPSSLDMMKFGIPVQTHGPEGS